MEGENMSSRVQRLVKFVSIIMHLNEISCDDTLLDFSKIWVILPPWEWLLVLDIYVFNENDFNMKSLCLLRERLLVFDVHMSSVKKVFVICSWKSVWYLVRCMEMVRNVYVLWDMVFVRYIRNICGKYVWIICEECIF